MTAAMTKAVQPLGFQISPTSEKRLRGVHPDLVRVVRRMAADWNSGNTGFIITCGVRSLEEQKEMVRAKASRTLRSRHIPAANGFAHAVDFACTMLVKGKAVPKWDWPLFIVLANAMKAAAIAEKVPVEWGGTWDLLNDVKGALTAAMLHKKFPDGPHFQLPWAAYPGTTKGVKK